jgi:hypothetical protein
MRKALISDYNTCYILFENGDVVNSKTNKKLKPYTNGIGYFRVGFYKDGKRIEKYIHRLLAEAFIPNPQNKDFINHIDGNPSNNTLSNLEWCTKSENAIHAYKLGLKIASPSYGEKNGNAILNNKIVNAIRERYKKGEKQIELSNYYQVSKQVIFNVVHNKTWNF